MKAMKTVFLSAVLTVGVSAAALAAGIPGAPAPFDKGGVKLAKN